MSLTYIFYTTRKLHNNCDVQYAMSPVSDLFILNLKSCSSLQLPDAPVVFLYFQPKLYIKKIAQWQVV